MGELIRFFSKRHGRVLDPFCGTGSSLIACAQLERWGEGIDLTPEYRVLYQEVAQTLAIPMLPYHVGDASQHEVYQSLSVGAFDFVIADPPYLSMLNKRRTGHRAKKGQSAATPFSDDSRDLGNMHASDFYATLIQTMRLCCTALRHHGHVAIFIKDMQPDAFHHNMLHADVVNAMGAVSQLRFRGYRIWHDANVNMFPFGYPHTFVANQTHQFILIFRKENP